jgi:NAD(P)-dependent dehydrogenase (short-subunit alcohol dehydrogenase family)
MKTVLITGGTDGLGKAAGLLLSELGYRVFAAGRNAERRAALDKIAHERKLPLESLDMDVCDDGSVGRAVNEIERKAGPVDALVNNAGVAIIATMEEISLADLHQQFETNYFGAVRVTQRVLPKMRRRRCGRIINMSSVAGVIANPLFGAYSGTKFAIEAFSDALRLELYPFGVYVVAIQPGYIPSGMENASAGLSSRYTHAALTSPYAQLYQNFLRFWKKATKNPRYAPEDCARVVLRALRETPPKPRYIVTRDTRMMRILRRLATDNMLDRLKIRMLELDTIRPDAPIDPSAVKAALAELASRERR